MHEGVECKLGQNLIDVGQMHLETVFIFVSLRGHPLELASIEELPGDVFVNCEISKWCLIFRAL